MQERRATQRTVLVLSAGLLAVSLAACGFGSSRAGTASTTRPPAPATLSPTPPTIGSTVTGAEFNQKLVQVLLAKQTATADVLVKQGGQTATGTEPLRFGPTGTDFHLTITASAAGTSKTVQYVTLAGKSYLQGPKPVSGRSWFLMGGDKLSRRYVLPLELIRQMSDLALLGRSFRVTDSFTLTGTRQVESVQVSDYTAVLEPEQVAAMADGALSNQGPLVRKQTAAYLTGGSEQIVVSVDADWVPRQVQETLTGRGHPTEVRTVTYRNWGQPVSIVAPDPAQVLDLATASALGAG